MVKLGEVAGIALEPENFVFPKSPGSKEPMPPNTVGQAWRRVCEEFGVHARLHDLRHLQASLLLDAGEAITTVAARLGHRDTSTTLRIYSHLMPGADQRAAGIVGKAFSRTPELVASAEASHEPEARSADARLGTSLDAIDRT